LYFLPNKCTNNEGLPKDNTEIVTPTPENKAEEIISQKVVNKAGYGPTQILEAALWQNKEMRDLANLPTPMLTPDLFKELGEKIHVIDSSGNEIRLKGEVIGGISEVVYNKDSGFTLIIDNKNGKTVDVRHEGEIGITNHGPTKAEYASTKGGKTISWEDANNLNK